MRQYVVRHRTAAALTTGLMLMVVAWVAAARGDSDRRFSDFVRFSAPAGDRPATTDTVVVSL